MSRYHQLIRHSGNHDLFSAVEMSIVSLTNHIPLHIHAEGLRGTGKTTIMRSAKELLPPIIRIKDCIYNCHPDSPHCPAHHHLSRQEIMSIGTEVVPCPFLEISHAAKIGTVVGSIDLGKLTDSTKAMAAILPGTIPQAHRGVIFIDEINRLTDASPELADVLLDVMGTKPGHIQIEETGLATVELPVSVTIWAASNPDEEPGALNLIRKQLSDRFDFGISMSRPSDYQAVFNILKQRGNKELIESDPQLYDKSGSVSDILIEEHIRNVIAKIYVDFNLESLRSVETMELAASIACLMAGRQKVDILDLMQIVPLALTQRSDKGTIAAILKYLECVKSGSWNMEGAYQKQYSNETIQNSPVNERYGQVSWWKEMIASLRSKMRFLEKFRPDIGSQGNSGKSNVMSAGNVKMEDPAKVNFVAPPRKAVSMRELPVEEFINSEENKPNG